MTIKTFRVIMKKTGVIETTYISGGAVEYAQGDNKVFYVLVDDNKIVDMKTTVKDLPSGNRKEFTDAQIEAYMENLSLNKPITSGEEPDNHTESDLYDKETDIVDSDAEDTPTNPERTIRNLIEEALLNKFKIISR